MTQHRFLVPTSDLEQAYAVLAGEEFHHLRVRRIRIGEQVSLTDGLGRERRARVVQIQRNRALLELLDEPCGLRESALAISLCIASIEPAPLEFALQKGTELGVHEFVVFAAARSVRVASEQRLQRWQRIVQESAKQAQRARVPNLTWVQDVRSLLTSTIDADVSFVLTPDSDAATEPAIAREPLNSVRIVIGPEGGLTPAEIQLLDAAGFQRLSLGPRILRAETAAIAVTAVLQWLCGDLRHSRPNP